MPKQKKVSYFGMKSEPAAYSWDELVKEKETYWDGVRNYQARNVMKDMKIGDLVLFYHSMTEKAFVGVAEVTKEWYQDPTTEDTKWVAVDIIPIKELKKKVSLRTIKEEPKLSEMKLVKQSRLSVFHIDEKDFKLILKMAETKLD
eukprot:TRINITY_DN10139_c0_g2_i1.p1 TRINITY_DN10139_c0_g2~~TRINITY_DN10139_c0_g2_i1.p1  ORF type:complete len:145 (+),score=29.42 TRINITY_DN10139_c0_g2_i1:63-497(+)